MKPNVFLYYLLSIKYFKNIYSYDPSFTALVTPFHRTFFIKFIVGNVESLPFCPFSDLMAPFSAIAFMNEEAQVCIN